MQQGMDSGGTCWSGYVGCMQGTGQRVVEGERMWVTATAPTSSHNETLFFLFYCALCLLRLFLALQVCNLKDGGLGHKPPLVSVVGDVHRGQLTLHFFDKSAVLHQIKTKCSYNNPDLNWIWQKLHSKGKVTVWEIAGNGHAMRSTEICLEARDRAIICAEPTT